ncbi:MAG TPA: lysophospholipid acyltransferase family protein [Candidatus Limnocylindria bacterium]
MTWIARPETPRERLWLWNLGFPLVRAVARTLAPIRVEGCEHLPQAGAYIVVANHIDMYDPFAIEFALGVPIRYMAKRELFVVPVLGFILRAIGNFPVRRGESDRRALETALRVLQAGQPLGFFPEGTRSKDGSLRRGKPGIGFLARRSGASMVPVAVTGTPQAGVRIPPRGDIVVRVGPPFTLADLDGRALDDQALADAIMERIAEMLPPRMRGAYGQHDRP